MENRRQKIKDEVRVLSVHQLLIESQQWWALTLPNPHTHSQPGPSADQAGSLQTLASLVAQVERDNLGPNDPVYAKAKERLALYCEKRRWNHGGRTPPQVERNGGG